LTKVAELSGTSAARVKELNPALVRGIVPKGGYTIRLPRGTKANFERAYARADRRKLEASALAVVAPSRHTVRRGETIGSIARRHRVSSSALMRANNIRDARRLQVGRRLLIPGRGASAPARVVRSHYRIRPGDTVASIAQRHRVSIRSILRANGISDPRKLRVGRKLVIPGVKS
jgi:membrane-bound lytic murein transglycosylase D